jgi:hypothetical protein
MKSGTVLAAAMVALTSLPILAQQPAPATQPGTPATQSTTPAAPSPAAQSPATQQPPADTPAQASPAASPETPAVAMSPVTGELESKLDSKTAKTGDNVVIRTKSNVKTADGTEIPKGSKLMGHVIAVKPSDAGTSSQVALEFDHFELKGGQSLAVRSQIQSISPAGGSDNMASTGSPASGYPTAGGATASATPMGSNGASAGQRPNAGMPTSASSSGPAATDAPAPGTVVGTNGNIAIATTAIPGVLLANNAPGQQDPRMAKTSSILLGAKKDIQLDGGTQVVVGIAAAGGAGQ